MSWSPIIGSWERPQVKHFRPPVFPKRFALLQELNSIIHSKTLDLEAEFQWKFLKWFFGLREKQPFLKVVYSYTMTPLEINLDTEKCWLEVGSWKTIFSWRFILEGVWFHVMRSLWALKCDVIHRASQGLPNLKDLAFGACFNQTFDPMFFPYLRSLTLGAAFDQSLEDVAWDNIRCCVYSCFPICCVGLCVALFYCELVIFAFSSADCVSLCSVPAGPWDYTVIIFMNFILIDDSWAAQMHHREPRILFSATCSSWRTKTIYKYSEEQSL